MRIVLSGYYGCGNTGDEAVLGGIAQSFAGRGGPDTVRLSVLSANPDDTRRRHGLDAVARMRYPAVRQVVKESDLLLSGGGSLLQDATSLRSLVYYLAVMRQCRAWGRPFMVYAQGIGPLHRPLARALVRRVVDNARYITVRDAPSAELLHAIGVWRAPVEVTADPAFALAGEPPQVARDRLARAGAPTGVPLIGIALRPWRTMPPDIEEYVRMVANLAAAARAHIVLLPMQPPGDASLADQVARGVGAACTVVTEELSPQAALGIVGQLRGLVAMRLHALIFGAMQGVPLVALEYDPKVACLMSALGMASYSVPLGPGAPSAAAERMLQALQAGDALSPVLRGRAREMAELALVNVDRALAAGRG